MKVVNDDCGHSYGDSGTGEGDGGEDLNLMAMMMTITFPPFLFSSRQTDNIHSTTGHHVL